MIFVGMRMRRPDSCIMYYYCLCSVVLNMRHARALFARKFETEGRLDGCRKDGFLLHMHVSSQQKMDGWMEQLTRARLCDVFVLLTCTTICL
jgi:hypothetical protein